MPFRAIALAAALGCGLPTSLQASFIDADLIYSSGKSAAPKKTQRHRSARARARPKSELECMARNIYFEAGVEDAKGKIAVANVTMNRVKSKHYPRSVCGVVFQRGGKSCAFSWTCDAKGNRPPRNKLYRQSLQIARLALSGALKDVTGQADHYHADYVRPGWRKPDKLSARIGRHIFYKMLDG
ncbi:MAG: cell wall hydrolase [Gammaproteobacteria bacterium SHHR-1]|uniref:cell wall hydrolase n=1 Tax=Magnetovirga frankeli TaxID=947516 RepID=UPI001AF24709|nr:cell wall hydrolase [gamma proteobacterium SS-5]